MNAQETMQSKKRMATPIIYYGGKQKMVGMIIPLIPNHKCYVEPFCGGSAVFFAKEPSKVEILNDKNLLLMNFYEQLQKNPDALIKKIDSLCYHEHNYQRSKDVIKLPEEYDELDRAAYLWFNLNSSFAGKMLGGFGFSKKKNVARSFTEKKERLKLAIERINNAQLLSRDAIDIIQRFDSEETFFFVDPPYVGADQGHYAGYTEKDFRLLLDTLETVKGKFMLTSYPSPLLGEYIYRNNWNTTQKEMTVTARLNRGEGTRGKEIEQITINYQSNEYFFRYF